MPFDSYRIHEVPDDLLAALDYCYEQGWTDGLPVMPPVIERVEATLAYEGRPPEAVIATHPATGLQLSVHAAAVNAVMAGCLPEYFPVLVAAFEAMDKPDFNFHGSTASTGGSAPLLIVSGPVADDIGMNADVNLFGPGNRANATIGRAVRLILRNVFQMIPGHFRQIDPGTARPNTASASPSAARGNPWPLLCEAQGYPAGVSSVTVFASGGFCNVENHGGNTPEQILGSGRRCDGQLRLHHLGPERRDPRAGAHAHRCRRRLEPRGRPVIPVYACQAAGRGNENRSANTATANTTSSTTAPRIRLSSRVSSIAGYVPRIS